MHAATAMLPDAASSQDRIFRTDNAVVMLDGASAFVPVDVSPGAYVDALGEYLIRYLEEDPEAPLADVLATAIRQTSNQLDLEPGTSPSSTVAIARESSAQIDLLVLGDTQIATPTALYVDNRLARFARREREAYMRRLAQGTGYDSEHRALLRSLQAEQARHRNQPDGYWIAEAVPQAAQYALTTSLPSVGTSWLVLATDGAYRPMRHLGMDEWSVVADMSNVRLGELLRQLDRWEACTDPRGLSLPRAKRHDDKALAALRPGPTGAESGAPVKLP